MPSHTSLRRAALASAIGVAFSSLAQAQALSTTLPPVVVTGNPFGSRDIATPVSVLTGDELTLRRGSSLGDTLNSTPGVSSSYFGPNANRPVIRGLDGDRVRVLSNAGASLDASSLSFDHAVPIDPLFIERLEVLRGPGALLYGGSAVGGVVNALDNRIPRERMSGVSGVVEARLGGAQSERGGAALVEAGNGQFVLHADVFGRNTKDLRVPTHTPLEDGSPLPETDRVRNSASRTHGGALGGSVFFDRGYLGVSVDTYDSRYGVVVEPDVTIQMKRDHVGLAGEVSFSDAPLLGLKAQLNHTRYEHQEIEGTGEIGTTFKTSGDEIRIEARHAPLGPLRGMFGVQLEDFDFSALGEEAFVPSTRTRKHALFALEELPWVGGTLSAGLRLERNKVSSEGDVDPLDAQFGPATERSFSLRSASLSNVFKLSPQWSLSGALSFSERAPTSFELYANGVHAATSAYERGDTTLAAERGNNLDVALEWKEGANLLRIGAFHARFSRFIALEATGNDVTVDGEDFPEYEFRSVRARMNGIEINGKQRLVDGPVALDLSGKLDLTRGNNLDTGEPLPRVAPLRALLGLDASHGLWGGRIELDHAARQTRVPATDTPTASYTIINLSLTRRFTLQSSDALWFLQLTNAGNELAYNAASIQTVRGLSPLPGRALKTGLRVSF
ncbi:MAG: TonB-dependent receptor [Rhizobacter sp.]|nr:TonB-dependent receptor [Rhizobacter sp.]